MKEWLYEKNKDNSARYILGTVGKAPLFCIGVNPSTAEPDALDNTLKSVERIAHLNGYDSFVMLNLYPQRATNPNDMHLGIDFEIHNANLESIKNVMSLYKNIDIWASWGTLIEKRAYLSRCLSDIYDISREYNCRWLTYGERSKKGHPHHPLYLRKDSSSDDFDIVAYIDTISVKI